MPSALLVTSLVNTIQVGSLYALMALGITLTFSVMKLPNFAHAEFITVGAYAALALSLAIDAHPIVILLAAALVGALVAAVSHRAVFKPLESQNLSLYTLILASFALGLIIRYGLFTLADSFNLFNLRIRIPLQIVFRDGFLIITNVFALVLPTSIVLVILLTLLLNRTALGREMRALANNAELARVIGIPVERVKSQCWLLVGALAGVAGALWGMYTSPSPLMGWLAILSAFAAAILGGLSSFAGTILGAYLVAFAENTLMLFLNSSLGVDLALKPAIPFIIIILALLLRPQGFTQLLTRRQELGR